MRVAILPFACDSMGDPTGRSLNARLFGGDFGLSRVLALLLMAATSQSCTTISRTITDSTGDTASVDRKEVERFDPIFLFSLALLDISGTWNNL
mmetsp:Transcript_27329/g.49652  ORF Transcript_27329/g.49652 Transcript_27329/m.49652 type:complete len:94 (-) Transcript_27329:1417-1698(-)